MLRKLLAVLASAVSLGLASPATAAQPLEIGYLPILPDAQLFVALETGTLVAPGSPAPKLIQFQSGPALVQSLLAGQLDAAYVGIGPAMVARAKGAKIKVVASNIIEQVSMVAMGSLAPYFASGDPSTTFARFTKDKGRKPVLASYPKGAVPEVALQYWLRNHLKINPSDVELVYQGESQIQQSLLTGAIDGAAILEPAVSLVMARSPAARIVAGGSEMFPNMPGAVLLVREKLIQEHPDVVRQLVKAHIEATKELRDDPAKSTEYVQKYVGGGRLGRDVVENAIRNSRKHFVADPRVIIEATKAMQAFQAQLGTMDGPAVDVADLFDTSYFDQRTKP